MSDSEKQDAYNTMLEHIKQSGKSGKVEKSGKPDTAPDTGEEEHEIQCPKCDAVWNESFESHQAKGEKPDRQGEVDECRRLAQEIFDGLLGGGMCEFDVADKIQALLQSHKAGKARGQIEIPTQSHRPKVSRDMVKQIVYEVDCILGKRKSLADSEYMIREARGAVSKILTEAGVEVEDDKP